MRYITFENGLFIRKVWKNVPLSEQDILIWYKTWLNFLKPLHWFSVNTVEPRCNEVPRDWQNVFAITRFRYIEVLFHIFYYYWGKENRSLYRGLRYIEVRYVEVPL